MAIKERGLDKPPAKTTEPLVPLGSPPRHLLTPEEGEAILKSLSEPPPPLSPEIMEAIQTYRRMKAETIP